MRANTGGRDGAAAVLVVGPKNQDPGRVETNIRPPARAPQTMATEATRPRTIGRSSDGAVVLSSQATDVRSSSDEAA